MGVSGRWPAAAVPRLAAACSACCRGRPRSLPAYANRGRGTDAQAGEHLLVTGEAEDSAAVTAEKRQAVAGILTRRGGGALSGERSRIRHRSVIGSGIPAHRSGQPWAGDALRSAGELQEHVLAGPPVGARRQATLRPLDQLRVVPVALAALGRVVKVIRGLREAHSPRMASARSEP